MVLHDGGEGAHVQRRGEDDVVIAGLLAQRAVGLLGAPALEAARLDRRAAVAGEAAFAVARESGDDAARVDLANAVVAGVREVEVALGVDLQPGHSNDHGILRVNGKIIDQGHPGDGGGCLLEADELRSRPRRLDPVQVLLRRGGAVDDPHVPVGEVHGLQVLGPRGLMPSPRAGSSRNW